MKILICGGRNFNDYKMLEETINMHIEVNKIFFLNDNVEIVSGCALGADQLAIKFANKHCLLVKKFPANWDKFGKSAGYIRNKEMAQYLCDSKDTCKVIAFWDGVSKGTKNMIEISKKLNLDWKIYYYGHT